MVFGKGRELNHISHIIYISHSYDSYKLKGVFKGFVTKAHQCACVMHVFIAAAVYVYGICIILFTRIRYGTVQPYGLSHVFLIYCRYYHTIIQYQLYGTVDTHCAAVKLDECIRAFPGSIVI